MKKIFTLLALLAFVPAVAQIVTTSPSLLQESSTGVVLTYHAASQLGNRGLAGLDEAQQVYVHIGVITNKSNSISDWRYTRTPWPSSDGSNAQEANTPANHLTWVAPDTYTLSIGSLRTYFGVTDPAEKIEKLAMVFRTADGSREGKTATWGDIFVDVLPEGFAMGMSCDAVSTVITAPTTLNFTIETTEAATLTLTVDGTQVAQQVGVKSMTVPVSITQRGSHHVVGTATNGTVTYTRDIVVAYPADSQQADYPGGVPKPGAVRSVDGKSVTFCLTAPGKHSVVLVPSWDHYDVLEKNTMNYQDYQGVRYFWTTVIGLDDHTWYPYYYLVDASIKVGDPYAHLVLDYSSDKWLDYMKIWPDMPQYPYDIFDGVMLGVYRGDIDDYNWSTGFKIPAHDQLIVYEMLFRDFTGTEGLANANGTVRAAIEKIPYLASLGINAVELMPIMEFNGNNSWGYNTNFYMAPDKAYGSPTDYKDFIDACHRAGIAVILDIVFNQSDGLHPWYQMYPIESNPFYNQYAPHSYSVLNDWHQGYGPVEQQWIDVVTYWLEKYNVDGFRFDLVKGLGDNNSYGSGTDSYNQSRINRMKRIYEAMKRIKPDVIHINEDLAGAQEEIELGNAGMIQWANINHNSCQFTMGFAESANAPTTQAFLATLNDGRPWGSTVSYAESHDEERMGYKNLTYGVATVQNDIVTSYNRLGSLAAIMMMTPGPKMIWQFGELGADQSTKTSDGGNDTSPKTVIWNWLTDPDKPYVSSLHDIYKAMCNLRQRNPELFGRDAEFATVGLATPLTTNRAMRLTYGDKEIMLFCNPNTGGRNKAVAWSSTVLNANNCQLITCTPGVEPRLNGTGTTVNCVLPPNSFAVFATNNVTGVDRVTVADRPYAVSVAPGEIVVSGDYTDARAYNLAGQLQPKFTGLQPGLYIVVVDGQATKVAVR